LIRTNTRSVCGRFAVALTFFLSLGIGGVIVSPLAGAVTFTGSSPLAHVTADLVPVN
jgi:hypothetical protein